jgi:cysteinyl-tRNA synthetase
MGWLREFITGKRAIAPIESPILFTNTMSGRKEAFRPLKARVVTMYSCGPTVYSKQHIGNLKAPLFADLIARTLKEAGYHLVRVINITDVGHLVGDGDLGEDKMAKGAREEQTTPEAIAERYTKLFLEDLASLNITDGTTDIAFPRATEYISEQIAMIRALESKGFAYKAEDGIYYDTSRFPAYGRLGGADKAKLLPGARVEKIPGKRNIHDFVLWRFAKPGDLQQWDSPWGRGNPGWHIECSAMIRALLGAEIDIHTGGIDHIPVHHNNEIAQSEAVNGKPLARYWMHEAFVTVNEEKVAKSTGNVIYLSDVEARGYHPLALRYFFLQAHYRSPVSFTWEALAAANEALTRLWRAASQIRAASNGVAYDSDERHRLIAHMRDDLGTPQALAVLSRALKDEDLSPEEKWGVILSADALLGLSLAHPPEAALPRPPEALPEDVQKLVYGRDLARAGKDYAEADRLRYQLEERGYRVDDGPSGTLLTRTRE